jgi:hypothetical protein
LNDYFLIYTFKQNVQMEASMNILFFVRKSKVNRNNQVPVFLRITIGGVRFEAARSHRKCFQNAWSP